MNQQIETADDGTPVIIPRRDLACAVCFIVIALLIIGLRRNVHQPGRLAPGESLWRLECRVAVGPLEQGSRIALSLPDDTKRLQVVGRSLYHPHFRCDTLRTRIDGQYELVGVARRKLARAEIVASFQFHVRSRLTHRRLTAATVLTSEQRERYLGDEKGISLQSAALREVVRSAKLEKLRRQDIPDRLFDWCVEHLSHDERRGSDLVDTVIATKLCNPLGRARTFIALCRACNVPARLVTGIALASPRAPLPIHWVEVFISRRWTSFDPERGHNRTVPATYVPLRRGPQPLMYVSDGVEPSIRFRIDRLRALLATPYGPSNRWFDILDLTLLPLGIQEVLALLLLLPVGALVTAIFRNVVGLPTFGTFTPALVGLSFVHSDWRTGLFVLCLVLLVGLLSRRALETLQLTMVPRLGVILTFTVLTVVHLVAVLVTIDSVPSARVILLPVVIMTLLVERFHVTAEEDGFSTALTLFRNTLIVAFLCWLVLLWTSLGQGLVTYPESLFAVIGLLVLVGRYHGYRLSELVRFRSLGRNEQ